MNLQFDDINYPLQKESPNLDNDCTQVANDILQNDLDLDSPESSVPVGWLQRIAASSENLPKNSSSVIELRPGKITIGRDSVLSDVQFKLSSLSRKHASIRTIFPSAFILKDLGSRNGTFVNDKQLPRGGRYSLTDGDNITLGDVRLLLTTTKPTEKGFDSIDWNEGENEVQPQSSGRKRKTPSSADVDNRQFFSPAQNMKASVTVKRNGDSLLFDPLARRSSVMFNETTGHGEELLSGDGEIIDKHTCCFVEETHLDIDPDNDESNRVDHRGSKEPVVNSFELSDIKFKDESKSLSDNSLKPNSLDLLQHCLSKSTCDDSPIAKIAENSEVKPTSTSESPLVNDTVIISESLSSNEGGPLRLTSDPGDFLQNKVGLESTYLEDGSAEGTSKDLVISETCLDEQARIIEEVNGYSKLLGVDCSSTTCDAKESPDSDLESPSLFFVKPKENCTSDSFEVNACDPVTDGMLQSNMEMKRSGTNQDVYNQETLDIDNLTDEMLEGGSCDNSNVFPSDSFDKLVHSKGISELEGRPQRSSLASLVDFSDDDGNSGSIMTSSQRDLANRTISSINTPMKDRLKRRRAMEKRLKELRNEDYKADNKDEEIPATFPDDHADNVSGLEAIKLELSSIESVSKKRGRIMTDSKTHAKERRGRKPKYPTLTTATEDLASQELNFPSVEENEVDVKLELGCPRTTLADLIEMDGVSTTGEDQRTAAEDTEAATEKKETPSRNALRTRRKRGKNEVQVTDSDGVDENARVSKRNKGGRNLEAIENKDDSSEVIKRSQKSSRVETGNRSGRRRAFEINKKRQKEEESENDQVPEENIIDIGDVNNSEIDNCIVNSCRQQIVVEATVCCRSPLVAKPTVRNKKERLASTTKRSTRNTDKFQENTGLVVGSGKGNCHGETAEDLKPSPAKRGRGKRQNSELADVKLESSDNKRSSTRKRVADDNSSSPIKETPKRSKRNLKLEKSGKLDKDTEVDEHKLDVKEEVSSSVKKSRSNRGRQKKVEPKGTKNASARSNVVDALSSTSSEHSCGSPRRSRSVGGQPIYVMFTGFSDKDVSKYSKQLKTLGCQLGDDVSNCTFLVTDKIRRTRKFLCALARGVSIVGESWIQACVDAKCFVDAESFILNDQASEERFGVSLKQSIESARLNRGVLRGFRVHVTASVLPVPAEMRDIIECAGGSLLPRIPASVEDGKTFIVTCEKDLKKIKKSLLPGCRSAEFVLASIMAQKIDPDDHKLA